MMWIMDSDGKGKRGLLYYLTICSYVMNLRLNWYIPEGM